MPTIVLSDVPSMSSVVIFEQKVQQQQKKPNKPKTIEWKLVVVINCKDSIMSSTSKIFSKGSGKSFWWLSI